MKTDKWKGVYAILLRLAVNLRDYSKYLSSQNIAMQGHHNSKKTFSFSDCGAFDTLSASSPEKTTPSVTARCKLLFDTVEMAGNYEVMSLKHFLLLNLGKNMSISKGWLFQ